jgi:hypothetical protein
MKMQQWAIVRNANGNSVVSMFDTHEAAMERAEEIARTMNLEVVVYEAQQTCVPIRDVDVVDFEVAS